MAGLRIKWQGLDFGRLGAADGRGTVRGCCKESEWGDSCYTVWQRVHRNPAPSGLIAYHKEINDVAH
jgi:hypothetical protein